jgi:hypothetical protein
MDLGSVCRNERAAVFPSHGETRPEPPNVLAEQPLFLAEVAHERPADLPGIPDTFWSFKHALKFLGKRAAQPPLGLMTVAALLPRSWKKRLVDTNVERLRDRDLAWADVVLLSGMHIQRDSLVAIVERCRALGLRTVVGGPIASSLPAAELKADHVVIGEAESLIAELARDLERNGQARVPGRGTAGDDDQPAARPEPDQDEPLLDHGRAVLARLPVQLRVLRHYRDLRPAAADQGGGAGAGGAGPVARGRLARGGVYCRRQLHRQQGARQGAVRGAGRVAQAIQEPASTSIPKPR